MLKFEDIEASRRELDISQAELCRRAGINQTTYWQAASGKTERMRGRTLRQLKAALDDFCAEAGNRQEAGA